MASAALTGTLTTYATNRELDIVTGGKTLIITLTADTFETAGAVFNATRQAIIDGIDSAQAEAAGWDAVVKAGLAVTDVARTSDTVVTVTLPAFAAYDITAQETITCTVPAAALTGGVALIATPTVLVIPDVSGFESLPVLTTTVALTPASYSFTPSSNWPRKQEAQGALITAETEDVRWKIDPAVTLTDTTNGHTLKVGANLVLSSTTDIKNFRVISISGSLATLRASYTF